MVYQQNGVLKNISKLIPEETATRIASMFGIKPTTRLGLGPESTLFSLLGLEPNPLQYCKVSKGFVVLKKRLTYLGDNTLTVGFSNSTSFSLTPLSLSHVTST